MALTEPLETRLFVGRRGVQSLIKWMLVNPAVCGPKVTKYHVLLKGFRNLNVSEMLSEEMLSGGESSSAVANLSSGPPGHPNSREASCPCGDTAFSRCPLGPLWGIFVPCHSWRGGSCAGSRTRGCQLQVSTGGAVAEPFGCG